MVQRDYGYNQPLGLPGGIFDLSAKRIVTRTIDPKVASKPGMGLVAGAAAGETVKLPSSGAAADTFEGVFVHGSKQMEHQMDGTVQTAGGEAVGLMQKGRIWALTAESATITYGKAAALITNGANTGKFTDSGDSKESAKVAIPGAKFLGKADKPNGIAVIELN